MPLFHINAEALEHLSTHHAMKKLSNWFNPTSGNEGGNYVVTRNDSHYIGGTSIMVQDAITSFTATGTLGTIGSGATGIGFTLDGKPVTAQFSLDLDKAQGTLNWTVAGGTPQTATFALILYHDTPAISSVSFYADTASDEAAYSLNILML
ncbi:MAG TPA: hypothetical protein VKR42_10955 [Ktedonobacteraceae bacterium]|nr:hypothetical protein [Ktedonobacteraceae bacterium]